MSIIPIIFQMLKKVNGEVETPIDPGSSQPLVIVSTNFVGDGNSLWYGYLSETSNTIGNPGYQLLTLAPFSTNGSTQVNKAVPAQTTVQMMSDAVSEIDSLIASGRPNILLVWEVTNDVATQSVTPQQAVDRMKQYCLDRKAAGWTVIVLTCLPRWQDQGYGLQAYSDKVDATVPLMVNGFDTWCDGIVNVRDDIRLNEYNTTYFNADMVHLKDAGYHAVAEDVAQILKIKAGLITAKLATPALSVSVNGSTQIDATFSSPTGTDTYIIQLATASNFITGLKQYVVSSASKSLTGLSASTTYYMRLKVRNLNNIDSDWSVVRTATTAAASGGGTAFPDSISGLFARWKPDDVVKDGSNNVSQLNDKSGNSRHLTQSGTAAVYHATGGVNSKPYIKMDSSRGYLNNSMALAQPFTVYHVFKHVGGAGRYLLFNSAGSLNVNLGQNQYGAYTVMAGGGAANFGQRTAVFQNGNAAGAFRFTFNGDSSRLQKNREPQSSKRDKYFASPGTAAMDRFSLNTDGTDVEWYESFVYSRDLNSSEKTQIANYFFAEYAIANDSYVAFAGDSISEGVGASPASASWTWLVANELGKAFFNYAISAANLHSAGVDTTLGWDGQVDEAAAGVLNNGYLVSVIGYNNDFNKTGGGYTINSTTKAQWKADYKAKIQDAINAGYSPSRIFLFSPLHSLTNYSGSNSEMDEMATVIQAIASELGVNYGDLLHYSRTNASSYTMPDDIHPDNAGHRLIANFVKSSINGV